MSNTADSNKHKASVESAEDSSSDSEYDESGPALTTRQPSWRRLSTNVCRKGVIKEGYLLKHASSFQRLKRYHCILKCGTLFYGKDKSSSIHVEISLVGASVAECSKKNVSNSFTIISPLRSFVFTAECRKEMEKWITTIRSTISISSKQTIELPTVAKHHWYTSSCTRGSFCNVCRDTLSTLRRLVLACEVCQMMVHKKCAAKSTVSCKWTHSASMPSDCTTESNSMPHQWVEGNLEPGSRCAQCDKVCSLHRGSPHWRCLWCLKSTHNECRATYPEVCDLGPQGHSILSPLHLHAPLEGHNGPTITRVRKSFGSSPLLVFINSKSGDTQGVKFLRKFKELLNPVQVFDLMNGGPLPGLSLFQELEQFRVMVCGGDGSVGWVLSAIDRLDLHRQCQFGILPLGTGNDLARVFGWGSGFDNDILLPQVLLDYNHAGVKMLDRWSILIRSAHVGDKREGVVVPHEEIPLARYQTSIARHLLQLLVSEDNGSALHMSRALCRTIRDFVTKVGGAMEDMGQDQQCTILQYKCGVLNEKLSKLLSSINRDLEDVEDGNSQQLQTPDVIGRANSLRRAVQRITDHIEQVVDEQHSESSLHIKSALPLPMCNAGLILPTAPRGQADSRSVVSEDNELHSNKEGRRRSSTGELEVGTETLTASHHSQSMDDMTNVATEKPAEPPVRREGSEGSVFEELLEGERGVVFRPSYVTISQYREVNVMNNYFGIGLDARISLEFHLKREEHPEKFHSRAKNIMRYGVISGRQFFMNKYKNLNQRIHMECDGKPVDLPTLQGIVVLNIASYMGGTNFWGTGKSEDGFTIPAIDDRMIEVVGVVGVPQLGISYMIGGLQHHRLAQCRSVRFTIIGDPVPVQVDGEAWMQEPGYIKITHKNRAQMLFRDKNFKHTLSEWNSKMEGIRMERGLMTDEEVQVVKMLCQAVKKLIELFVSLYKETEGDEDLLIRAGRTQADMDMLFSGSSLARVEHSQCLDFLSDLKSLLQEITWYMKVKLPAGRMGAFGINSALRARVEGAIASVEEELRLLPERLIALASEDSQDINSHKVRRFLRNLSRLKITGSTAPLSRTSVSFDCSPDSLCDKGEAPPAEWNVHHVMRWLGHLDLGQYCTVFQQHDIHGKELLELSYQDMKDLGMVKVGHIKRLLHAIDELKSIRRTRRMSAQQ